MGDDESTTSDNRESALYKIVHSWVKPEQSFDEEIFQQLINLSYLDPAKFKELYLRRRMFLRKRG